MKIDIGGGAFVLGYKPGIGERDTVTLETHGCKPRQVTWGSLIAQTNGDILSLIPSHHSSRAWDPDKHPRAPDGKFGHKLESGQSVVHDGDTWQVFASMGDRVALTHVDGRRKMTFLNEVQPADRTDPVELSPTGPKPDDDGLHAIQTYAGQGYLDINHFLRHDEPTSDPRLTPNEVRRTVARIDALMKKHQTREDVTVYRGVANLGPIGPGVELDDDGFQSSTPDLEVAKEFGTDVLRIKVPKGSKAINMSELAGTGEQELLLDRGGSLTVTGVEVGAGVRFIDVTLEQYR